MKNPAAFMGQRNKLVFIKMRGGQRHKVGYPVFFSSQKGLRVKVFMQFL